MNDNVDYRVEAELFPGPSHRHKGLSYHRFDTLAEALRFAVEELSQPQLAGAFIEAEEVRYGPSEILGLYSAAGYPLERQSKSH
jgi:hypothetical protein